MQAEDETQRNEWIAHINYASTFKTAGVRMRPAISAEESKASLRRRDWNAKKEQPSPTNMSTMANNDDHHLSVVGEGSNILSTRPRSMSSTTVDSMTSQSRYLILQSKIREFDGKLNSTQSQLDADMRAVRSIAVLTPFMRSSRERLQMAVAALGRSIRQLRLEVVKTVCYRDVLAADLTSERREQRLQSRDRLMPGGGPPYPIDIPRMTLSVHEESPAFNGTPHSLSHSDLTDPSAELPESSICESFHSALDFTSDWPLASRSDGGTAGKLAQNSALNTSTATTANTSITPNTKTELPAGRTSWATPSVASSRDHDEIIVDVDTLPKSSNIEQIDAEEQAEEWHKTRAAKRVSLVTVPQMLSVIPRVTKEGHYPKALSRDTEGS